MVAGRATIAFVSKRSGNSDIYAMAADGSGTRPLTKTKEANHSPTGPPTARRSSFPEAAPLASCHERRRVRVRRLTDEDVDETEPDWSPDGSTIAYVRRTPGSSIRELWLVQPDGSQRRQLTKLDGVAQAPAWSPDGERIAYSADLGESRFDIYSIGTDGKDARLLTSGEDAFEPAWSPDGKTISFFEAGAIVSLDIETGEETSLTDAENNDSSPTWKPPTSKPQQGGTG